jgi:hypothetical protein
MKSQALHHRQLNPPELCKDSCKQDLQHSRSSKVGVPLIKISSQIQRQQNAQGDEERSTANIPRYLK